MASADLGWYGVDGSFGVVCVEPDFHGQTLAELRTRGRLRLVDLHTGEIIHDELMPLQFVADGAGLRHARKRQQLVVVPYGAEAAAAYWRAIGFRKTRGAPGLMHLNEAFVQPRVVRDDRDDRFRAFRAKPASKADRRRRLH